MNEFLSAFIILIATLVLGSVVWLLVYEPTPDGFGLLVAVVVIVWAIILIQALENNR